MVPCPFLFRRMGRTAPGVSGGAEEVNCYSTYLRYMPNIARKYGDKVVIEPARVIQERKQIGLRPSCPVPAGAILCYDIV